MVPKLCWHHKGGFHSEKTWKFSLSGSCNLLLLLHPGGILNLLVLSYPRIKIYFLCVPRNHSWTPLFSPPNQELHPNVLVLGLFYSEFQFWSTCIPPCKLLVLQGYEYPRLRTDASYKLLPSQNGLFDVNDGSDAFSVDPALRIGWIMDWRPSRFRQTNEERRQNEKGFGRKSHLFLKIILKFYIKDVISKLNTDYILYLFKAAKDSLRKVNQKWVLIWLIEHKTCFD